ncbi:MAG: helix-turn-helix domain-containing protein [Mycobacteriales bacterium]
MQDVDKRFAARIRFERNRRDWSQERLAKELRELPVNAVDLDPTAITRIERGTRAIRLAEAAGFADVFGLTVTQMTETDNWLALYVAMALTTCTEAEAELDRLSIRNTFLEKHAAAVQVIQAAQEGRPANWPKSWNSLAASLLIGPRQEYLSRMLSSVGVNNSKYLGLIADTFAARAAEGGDIGDDPVMANFRAKLSVTPELAAELQHKFPTIKVEAKDSSDG